MGKNQILLLLAAVEIVLVFIIVVCLAYRSKKKKDSIEQKKNLKDDSNLRNERGIKIQRKEMELERYDRTIPSASEKQCFVDDGDNTVKMDVDEDIFEESADFTEAADKTVVIEKKLTYIVLENCENSQQVYQKMIQDAVLIGRKKTCDICISGDKTISSFHCKIIKLLEDEFYIEDLNSTNGTYLNGNKVECRMSVKTGDRIEIGETALILSIVIK